MRWDKGKRAAAVVAVLLLLQGIIIGIRNSEITAYAMQNPDSSFTVSGGFGESRGGSYERSEEGLEYDQDIETFMNEYFEMLEAGDISSGVLTTKHVKDPELTIEQGSSGRIRYHLPNHQTYEATVPSGMVTSGSVEIHPPAEVLTFLVREDGSTSMLSDLVFDKPGSYQIRMFFTGFKDANAQEYEIYEINHYFTITEKSTNQIGAVTAPKGFYISFLKCNGIPQEILSPKCHFLSKDGRYEVRYTDIETGRIHRDTVFERDTKAPFLTFSQEMENGKMMAPVEYYPSERGSRVTVSYNGNIAESVTNVLNTAGAYGLTVYDSAGNYRTYEIKVQQKQTLFDKRMIILVLFLAGAAVFHFMRLRRETKFI